MRSYPIVSLSFLKKLKKIHGKKLDNGQHSIVIWDNPNLQALFKKDQNIEISHGKVLFYMNPKLCYDLIVDLVGDSRKIENIEATKRSNGDKVPCNVTELNVTVKIKSSSLAILNWDSLPIGDDRKLLSYVVYYVSEISL